MAFGDTYNAAIRRRRPLNIGEEINNGLTAYERINGMVKDERINKAFDEEAAKIGTEVQDYSQMPVGVTGGLDGEAGDAKRPSRQYDVEDLYRNVAKKTGGIDSKRAIGFLEGADTARLRKQQGVMADLGIKKATREDKAAQREDDITQLTMDTYDGDPNALAKLIGRAAPHYNNNPNVPDEQRHAITTTKGGFVMTLADGREKYIPYEGARDVMGAQAYSQMIRTAVDALRSAVNPDYALKSRATAATEQTAASGRITADAARKNADTMEGYRGDQATNMREQRVIDRERLGIERARVAAMGSTRQTAAEALEDKASALAKAYIEADTTGKMTPEAARKRAFQALVKDPELGTQAKAAARGDALAQDIDAARKRFSTGNTDKKQYDEEVATLRRDHAARAEAEDAADKLRQAAPAERLDIVQDWVKTGLAPAAMVTLGATMQEVKAAQDRIKATPATGKPGFAAGAAQAVQGPADADKKYIRSQGNGRVGFAYTESPRGMTKAQWDALDAQQRR